MNPIKCYRKLRISIKRYSPYRELKKSRHLYIGGIVVFFLSLGLGLALHEYGIVSAIAAFPGGAAAVGLVVQIIRDNEKHKRDIELQKNNQGFSLAFTSQMSEFLFKKHVEFCEEYIGVLHSFSHKPSNQENFKQYGQTLKKVRLRYIIWLKSDINEELKEFESSFALISLFKEKINSTYDEETIINCTNLLHKTLNKLYGLTNKDQVSATNSDDEAIDLFNITERMQKILHIETIDDLRHNYFSSQLGKN